MFLRVVHIFFFLVFLVLMSSCDKGYEVRFTNYYLEPIDSVVVGANEIVFKSIPFNGTTEFVKLRQGTYGVNITSSSKKKFSTSITIPKSGTGKRTIQIDGTKAIYILEE